jgi:serine/threonine-protein kinase
VPPTLPGAVPFGDSDVLPEPPVSHSRPPPVVPASADEPLETIGHIGRYALKYRIGEGGLGTVYAAQDPLLSRLIAIKTLNLEIGAEEREAFNALFLQEARAAASLSHPNIVTVFDAGVSDNSAYIAMELLKGRDLRQLRKEGWRPTPAQAALIARRVADALAYAHTKGIVHCDVKPANIFMVGRTQPRVLDFGIARIANRHDGASGLQIAAGSPYYMAPEQVRGEDVDRRADVFSLGVVLYEMLTDRKPFRGDTLDQITGAVLDFEPPLAHEVDPQVPEPLSRIAERAMAKDKEARFRSARALSRELRHWLEEQALGANPAAAGLVSEPVPSAPAPKRRTPVFAIAAGLAAVAAVAAWFTLGHDDTGSAVAAARLPAPSAAPAALASLPVQSTSAGPALAAAEAASAAAVVDAAPVQVTQAEPAPAPKPAASTKPAPKPARDAKPARRDAKPAPLPPSAAPLATGMVRIAVSPWGQIEVDGATAGTTPPINEISLPEGKHQITIRNADFPPHSVTVNVTAGQPVVLKHRFGS